MLYFTQIKQGKATGVNPKLIVKANKMFRTNIEIGFELFFIPRKPIRSKGNDLKKKLCSCIKSDICNPTSEINPVIPQSVVLPALARLFPQFRG